MSVTVIWQTLHRGSTLCVEKIFSETPRLLQHSASQGSSTWSRHRVLLQEGVPVSWCSTLSHTPVDKRCPVAGRDDDDVVLKFVQDRISCRIPEEDSNPELHRLVTKYQYHKCNSYCQRRKRVRGGIFITRCRFGFPRETCESATLFSVDECMKLAHRKLYKLPRSPEEIRTNNYNPLVLLLWKANIDLQYIGESSMAIAQYVTGYVTKAERSNMQDLWQEVSSHESIYSKLWSFGIRSLRSRECGLYEASDLLLGDHLCGKSQTVVWVNATQQKAQIT